LLFLYAFKPSLRNGMVEESFSKINDEDDDDDFSSNA